jgi:hypothetical protein
LYASGLPPILQSHLKRFHFDWMTETMTKLNQPMPFPLDLSDIVVTNQNNDNDNKEKVDNADDDHNDCSSELQAVVIRIR